MSFYSDTSFYVLLAIVMCGAAFLGLRGRPLKRYGLVASLAMVGLMFLGSPVQAACAAAYISVIVAASQWLFQNPKSKPRFRACLACVLGPLVLCKVSGAFGTSMFGFVGISYLMFRAVQVLIETHDGIIHSMDPLDLLYFLVFFPTFPSGPIDRSRRFQQDLNQQPTPDEYAGLLGRGILLVMLGMVYKIVLASIAKRYYIPVTWDSVQGDTLWRLFIQIKVCYAYGLYLFFDFAGYSLMALGASYALGIRTPRNFRAPFLATSITDFWNRWHITLSTWLRDFVFMRIARAIMRRKLIHNRLRTSQVALIANMLIMGAWHGLTASYLLYGLYHGILLAAEQGWQKTAFYKRHKHQTWYRVCSWFVTMQLVFFGFALFSGQIALLVKGN